MRKYNISETYEIVSEESAINGDFEETGFTIENDEYTAQEIADHLKRNGYYYFTNGCSINGGRFCTSSDIDYSTGNEETRNFHVNTPMDRRVFSAICAHARIKIN